MSVCVCVCVCLSVCLSVREDISGTTHAIFTKFLCMLPMSVARSSTGMSTIGRIAYRREGGDGSAQHGRSVIYNCHALQPIRNMPVWTYIKFVCRHGLHTVHVVYTVLFLLHIIISEKKQVTKCRSVYLWVSRISKKVPTDLHKMLGQGLT